jgi:hypothetical protein
VARLAVVFDFELELEIAFLHHLSDLFCCEGSGEELPVGVLNSGDSLVDDFDDCT